MSSWISYLDKFLNIDIIYSDTILDFKVPLKSLYLSFIEKWYPFDFFFLKVLCVPGIFSKTAVSIMFSNKQTRCSRGCHLRYLLINSMIDSSFCSKSSRHCQSQTVVRARELKFWENVHPHYVWHVTCHMSCVTCQVSHVRYQVSHVVSSSFFFLDKVVELIIKGSVNNGAYSF